MSLFKRLFQKVELPDWADFLSQSEYKSYCAQLSEVLAKVSPGYQLFPTEGYYTLPEKEESQFGIVNLAQVWKQVPTQERRECIEEFVTKMLTMDARPPEQLSFEEASPLLRIRLYPIGFLPDTFGIVTWPISPSFQTVLTVDMPDSVQSVNRDALEKWGFAGTDQELFDLALSQTWSNESVLVETMQGANQVPIRVVSGDSFFSATHALLLDRYVIPADPNGVLLAIPHRHTFAFHPIGDGSKVDDAIATLLPMGRGMFSEGPGSITPELFWWCDGSFTVLSVSEEQGRAVVQLPEELSARLASS